MTAKRDRMPKEEKHPEKMTYYFFFFLTNLINICFSIEILEKKNKFNYPLIAMENGSCVPQISVMP